MAIQSSEIKFVQSQVVNDTSSNGGRMSTNVIETGLVNVFWPYVPESELSSGSTKYRKFFYHIRNAENKTANNIRICFEAPTAEGDRQYLFAGTQTDIQSQISSPTLYGSGVLNSSVSAGATSLSVLVEDGTKTIFRNGDLIRISDNAMSDGTYTKEEFVTINSSVTVAGSVHSFSFTPALVNGYTASSSYISSVMQVSSVVAHVDTKVVTSTSGTFDLTKVTANNIGAIEDVITFTFSSSTAFTCSGAIAGSLGTGNINSNFGPNNPAFGSAYFLVIPAAWGGTYALGDTVSFKLHPASVPGWQMRVVPEGTSTIELQDITLIFLCESA